MAETMPDGGPDEGPDKGPDNSPDQATGKATDPDRANVLVPPPLIFLAALLVGLLLQRLVPVGLLPAAWAAWIGGALLATAIPLALWGARSLRTAHTAVDPRKPTTAIVQRGPYRLSRNPLYLSMILLCVAIAALCNTAWIVLALIPALVVLRRGVIDREEAYLERKFGAEYRAYRARVRRWI